MCGSDVITLKLCCKNTCLKCLDKIRPKKVWDISSPKTFKMQPAIEYDSLEFKHMSYNIQWLKCMKCFWEHNFLKGWFCLKAGYLLMLQEW